MYTLDTTAYSNGIHTIYWIAKDDVGNADGIGSRFFSIQNSGARSGVSDRGPVVSGKHTLSNIPVDDSSPVGVIKGFNRNMEPFETYPDENGIIKIETRELEHIETRIFPVGAGGVRVLAPLLRCAGYQVIGSQLRPLPIGSTLDRERGVFYWLPGPGFLGEFLLLFVKKRQSGEMSRKHILITIVPKFTRD